MLHPTTSQVGPTDGLGAVLHAAAAADCPVYLLFPSDSSQDLATACKERHQRQDDGHQRSLHWAYVLIAIDGTWRQGREMYNVRPLVDILHYWHVYLICMLMHFAGTFAPCHTGLKSQILLLNMCATPL